MLRIAPHISWNPVEGELALFDSRSGTYHALNPSGAAIWRAIAAGQSEAVLVDTLAAAHDIPRATVAEDVRTFVAEALAKSLLVEEAD